MRNDWLLIIGCVLTPIAIALFALSMFYLICDKTTLSLIILAISVVVFLVSFAMVEFYEEDNGQGNRES